MIGGFLCTGCAITVKISEKSSLQGWVVSDIYSMMIPRLNLLFLPLFMLVGCETTEPAVKRSYISSYRGMSEENVSGINKSLVSKADPAALKKYTKVVIEDVKVIPSRNLPANQKRATMAEGERLAEHFESTLEKELSPYFDVTSRRGQNTLVVRAALTELQPSNPAIFVFNYLPYAAAVTTGLTLATGKTPGAGSTSMEAEVVDSSSRRQLYAIVDRFQGSKFQPGGIAKWGQSEGAMRSWSRQIRMGIQANNKVGASRGPTPAAKLYFKNQEETKPVVRAAKPAIKATKPVVRASKPAVTANKPAARVGNNGVRMIVRSDGDGIQKVSRRN